MAREVARDEASQLHLNKNQSHRSIPTDRPFNSEDASKRVLVNKTQKKDGLIIVFVVSKSLMDIGVSKKNFFIEMVGKYWRKTAELIFQQPGT